MDHQSSALEVEREAGPQSGVGGANDGLDASLYRGVKSLLRCDEAEAISGIARFVVSQHWVLRLLSALIERTRGGSFPAMVALVGALKSFLAVQPLRPEHMTPSGARSEGVAWIARLGNERRAIEPLARRFPEFAWKELKFQWRPASSAIFDLVRTFRSASSRIFRMARLLHRRYEFYQALRGVELITYYARYLAMFQTGRFALAVTSNHSNPHGIAFNLAARKSNVPVVLITHGMPVRPVARLTYDLAVVHCDAARQTYLEEGCRLNRALVHGRRQDHVLMPVNSLPTLLRVGFFLCKDVNENRLRELVERLLDEPRVERILIRPHPTNLWTGLDAWIDSLNEPRAHRSRGSSVSHDIEASDIVLAGNSSVLVEAVTAGRPSGYVPDLDYGSPDLHAFVTRGLIYPINDDLGFDPDAMLRFYQRPAWSRALRRFANVDEDEAAVAARVGDAMRDLIESREAPSLHTRAGRVKPV